MQNNKYFIINEKCPKRLLETKKETKIKKVILTFFAFDFKYNLKNHHLLNDDDVFGEVFA